jgi:hypothetical protein
MLELSAYRVTAQDCSQKKRIGEDEPRASALSASSPLFYRISEEKTPETLWLAFIVIQRRS